MYVTLNISLLAQVYQGTFVQIIHSALDFLNICAGSSIIVDSYIETWSFQMFLEIQHNLCYNFVLLLFWLHTMSHVSWFKLWRWLNTAEALEPSPRQSLHTTNTMSNANFYAAMYVPSRINEGAATPAVQEPVPKPSPRRLRPKTKT